MSLKKSEILRALPRATTASGWRATGVANLPLLLAIAILIPIGYLIEGGSFDPYSRRVLMLIGFNIILAVSLQLINGFSGQFSLGHAGFMAVGAYLAAYPAINYSNGLADPGMSLLFFLALGIAVGLGATAVGLLFLLMRASRRLGRQAPAVLFVALLAWILCDFAMGARTPVAPGYLIWSHGLAGLQHLFAAILNSGARLGAGASAATPSFLRQPVCFLILLGGGGICAAVVGFIVGLPALRLHGDYLAIATLGLAEIIRIAIQNSQPLGGALGLTSIPKYTDFTWLYAMVIITVVVIWRIAYSPKGRAIMAVREDEIAAASIGVNSTRYKVLAFVVGAFFAGVAGALFSLHERSITPSYFSILKSIEPVVMVTLGGLASISGAILAAIVLTLLPEVLRSISPEDRMVIYALLLIIMMLLRPQGLLGGRELWPRRRLHLRVPAPTQEEPVPA